jgi:ASC-1-like (ASCH) protein
MTHTLNVQTKYYNLLKSGQKTVELRLWDEKRQTIKVHDTIVFSDAATPADTFEAKVVALHRFDSFSRLCQVIPPATAGFGSADDLLKAIEGFYPADKQKQYGVVGIEVKKIS